MNETIDVSIIIVNFNSGPYLIRCLDSLLAAPPTTWNMEIVVVENASTIDQQEWLQQARDRGARVIGCRENTGWSGGCNRGLRASSGRFVVFLNPDTLVFDGTLDRLLDYLETHPEAAFVEPRIFLDADRTFCVSQFRPPTPWELILSALGRASSRMASRLSYRRLRSDLAYWQVSQPFERIWLLGAMLIVRREVMERLGLYDERFLLYYEDADLYQRARKAGYRLFQVPGAEVMHLHYRSSETVWEEAMRKSRQGRSLYLRKNFGFATTALDRLCDGLVAAGRLVHKPRPFESMRNLGSLEQAPEIVLKGPPGPFLLELATEPFFLLVVGHLGHGRSYPITRNAWDALLPGPYYLRALDCESLQPRGAWKLRKV